MEISKLLPILMLLGIGAHSKDAMTRRLAMVLDLQHTIVTTLDLRTIMKQAVLDSVGEPDYQIRDLRAFVGSVLEKNDERDVTLDTWGTEYRHKIEGRSIRVSSAGPDKAFGTGDDIEVEGTLLGQDI